MIRKILVITLLTAVLELTGVVPSPAAQAPAPRLEVPGGYSYADALLDGSGHGFVLWKNPDQGSSQLVRLDGFEPAARWHWENYLAKGFWWQGGDRLMLHGAALDGTGWRLVEVANNELKTIWTSAELTLALDVDPDQLTVSPDFQWWLATRFFDHEIQVLAGRLGEQSPTYTWSVDQPEADPFLATLSALTSSEDPRQLTLALTANGRGWLLSPALRDAVIVPLPDACQELVSLEAGTDGLWGHCTRSVHVLYATPSLATDSEIEPMAVVHHKGLRLLDDGTAITIERRHGKPGTWRTLFPTAGGEVQPGQERPFPVPYGVAGRIAGEQLLLPVVPTGTRVPTAYRAVPLTGTPPIGSAAPGAPGQ